MADYNYISGVNKSLSCGSNYFPNTFDNVRRAILQGLVSAQGEANGWNAKIADLPVSSVVRTSDTVVTITLSGLSGYDITLPETITVNVSGKAVAAGVAIVATPTFGVGVEHPYVGYGARSFQSAVVKARGKAPAIGGAMAYSDNGITSKGTPSGTVYIYIGDASFSFQSNAGVYTWSDWSDTGQFDTAGIINGAAYSLSCGTVVTHQRGRTYVGQGVLVWGDGSTRSIGRVYAGGGAFHLAKGSTYSGDTSLGFTYNGRGTIVFGNGTVYAGDVSADIAYSGVGAFSLVSSFTRSVARVRTSFGVFSFYGGAASTVDHSTEHPGLEAKPRTRTVTHESLPERPAGQDGAYTEPGQDGAWDEYPVDGAYTDIGYFKEFKPFRRATMTKEDKPN